jgi:hypothetical protein
MGRKGTVIGLGLALLVAGGFWLFWGGGNGRTPVPRAATPPPTAREVSPEPEPTPAPTPILPAPTPVPETRSLAVRATWRDFAEPVKGVSISLSPKDVPRNEKTPLQPLTGVTDKAGRVALALPADTPLPSPLRVQVHADGPGVAPLFLESARVCTTETLELFLDKAYDFHGTVYWNPKGTGKVPAPGAQVAVVRTSDSTRKFWEESALPVTATTDAQGHYEIHSFPESPVRLQARLGEFVTVDAPVLAMPEHGKRSGPFDLYLEQGLTLVALVSDKATLQPIPNATVETRFASGGLSVNGTTNAEGFCNLTGVPTGSHLAIAHADGYTREHLSVEVEKNGDNTVAFYLDKGGRARIHTVHAETGKPIGNLELKVRVTYKGKFDQTVTCDAQGIALVDGLPTDTPIWIQPLGNTYRRTEDSPKKGDGIKTNTSFKTEEGKTVEVELAVVEGWQGDSTPHNERGQEFLPVQGTVVDEAGQAVPNALVTASSYCCRARTLTDSDGRFSIEKACVSVFPSNVSPLPDLETLRKQKPDYERWIDLEKKDFYVAREGYKADDGALQPYYTGPAMLQVDAEGYTPLSDIPAAVGREARIVLQDKSKGEASGRVLDKETKEPVREYVIRYRYRDTPQIEKPIYSKEGRFTLTGLSDDRRSFFVIEAEGYVQERIPSIKPGMKDLEILLEPQKPLEGLVVDGETQNPISDVEVRYLPENDVVLKIYIGEGFDFSTLSSLVSQVTDSLGAFSFKPSRKEGGLLLLPKDRNYGTRLVLNAERETLRNPESGKIVIPLTKRGTSVSLRFAPGQEAASVQLNYKGKDYRGPQSEPVRKNGVCRWDNLGDGPYQIVTEKRDPQEARVHLIDFELTQGASKSFQIGDGASASISGRILQANGGPAPNATLLLSKLSTGNEGDRIQSLYVCAADANGQYRFDHLVPGTYSHFEDPRLNVELLTRVVHRDPGFFNLGSVEISGTIQHDFALPPPPPAPKE